MINLRFFEHDPNTQDFPAGSVVFRTGDPGTEMYVVRSGEVDIVVNGVTLETVEAGGILGEMALIDQETRSADAIAKSDSVLVRVDKKRFEYLVQQTPFFALQMMKLLVKRLRNMDKHVKS